MGFLSKTFGKKKAAYQSRSYVGTPGGFHHQRSPSDILMVSHPSPGDYQQHLDSLDHVTRRQAAISFLSSDCIASEYSEDLFDEDSDDDSDVYSSEESSDDSDSFYEQQPRHIPNVNYQTAQEQWARLQAHPIRQQAPQPIQRVPVQREAHASAPKPKLNPYCQPAPQLIQRAQVSYQTPGPQQLSAVRPQPRRVSYLSTIRQHRQSDSGYYQAPAQPMQRPRHYSEPDLHHSSIYSAARLAARSAMGERSYHEKQDDAYRQKARLAPCPYKMVGGLPVPAVPGSWVD